jgi:hypothetical protein
VVPGGGLTDDGRWISSRPDFFLPVRVLSKLFRRLFLDALQAEFDAGQLKFFHALEPLREPAAFGRQLARLKACDWVVYAKQPFAGPQQVLDYVGRYTHRVAISNNRLLDIEGGQIQFKWKDYRNGDQVKTMSLSSDEFIRRFLMHVMPSGFHRIRYYGFLGNRYRNQKIAECRRLLGMQVAEPQAEVAKEQKEYREHYEDLTGRSLFQCPHCKQGTMVKVAILPRPASTAVWSVNSS